MAALLGTVIAGAQLGLDAILIRPHRSIGPFVAHATIKEEHTDELEITEQPVDQGAAISDHAFIKPARLLLEIAWSDSLPASNVVQGVQNIIPGTQAGFATINTGNAPSQIRDIYARLLALQRSRVPFAVFTGKRAYDTMLFESLSTESDKENENILRVRARLKQVLIAQVVVRTISAPAENQKDAAATLPVSDKGTKQLVSATTFNAGAAVKAGLIAVTARAQAAVTASISSKVTGLLG